MKEILRQYEFLLADPERDPDYTEGNEVGKQMVFGTAAEMRERIEQFLGKRQISSGKYIFPAPNLWHYLGCTIKYETRKDGDTLSEPRIYGSLLVVGEKPNVERVSAKLRESFRGLDDIVHDFPY